MPQDEKHTHDLDQSKLNLVENFMEVTKDDDGAEVVVDFNLLEEKLLKEPIKVTSEKLKEKPIENTEKKVLKKHTHHFYRPKQKESDILSTEKQIKNTTEKLTEEKTAKLIKPVAKEATKIEIEKPTEKVTEELSERTIHTEINDINLKNVHETDFSDTDLKFISSLSAAVIQKSTNTSRVLVWILFILIISFVSWASLTTVDEVTRASGKVIPSHQIQKVQHLDGGIVTEILIKEGNIVKKGQALIKIDSVGSQARLEESKIRLYELKAKGSRLKAQIKGKSISFASILQKEFAEIVEEERSLFESSMAQLNEKIDILNEQLKQRKSEMREAKDKKNELKDRYKLITKEISLMQPLLKKYLVSEVEFLKLERQASKIKGDLDASKLSIPRLQSKINEARKSMQEAKLGFSNKAKKEYNEVISEIARIEQTNALLRSKVSKTVLRSPVDGTVKQLLSNTVGGVIHPGRDIMEILPLEDSLLSEVEVRPSDIAYLRHGQEAMVKFSAYDFSIYGGLRGKLVYISADTITNEKGQSYYLVRVKTEKNFLGSADKPLKIMAGMTVTVDILTGKKTILDYILKPIFKAKENALRER